VVAKLQHSTLKPIAGLGGLPERILKAGKDKAFKKIAPNNLLNRTANCRSRLAAQLFEQNRTTGPMAPWLFNLSRRKTDYSRQEGNPLPAA
jgi:hypothetical protein